MFFLKILVSGIVGGVVFVILEIGIVLLMAQVIEFVEYLFDYVWDRKTSYLPEMSLYISGFFGVASFLFILWKLRNWGSKKFCAWCGEKSGLTKEKEYEGNYLWDYPNADGSEDKRIKDNFQKANYRTFWRCKKCSALTQFQHDMAINPSSSQELITVMLTEDGEGERTAKDWAGKGVHLVSAVR